MQNGKPNEAEGWSDASPSVQRGKSYDWISDELYHSTLAVHDILWRYAVLRFKKEEECPIAVIGYGSIPMAIELSQWTYPISYIAQSHQEADQVRTDCAHQAGFFKQILVTDPYVDMPPHRIIMFTGLLTELHTPQRIFRWLDLLTRRGAYVVCAEDTHAHDWRTLLEERYHVTGLWYNRGNYTFLELRRKWR